MTSEAEFLLATLRGQGTPAPPPSSASINWQILLDLASTSLRG